ncbi:MAG: hypothetical protein ACOCP8_01925 [archaeon]
MKINSELKILKLTETGHYCIKARDFILSDNVLSTFLNTSLFNLHQIFNKYNTYIIQPRYSHILTMFIEKKDIEKALEELQKFELMNRLMGYEV